MSKKHDYVNMFEWADTAVVLANSKHRATFRVDIYDDVRTANTAFVSDIPTVVAAYIKGDVRPTGWGFPGFDATPT